MKILVLIFCLLMIGPVISGGSCTNLIGKCDYYECVRQEKGCLRYTYLETYGYKFCKRATELREEIYTSAYLNDWIDETKLCLMEEIESFYQDTTCGGIRVKAFRSHSKCYVRSGFCGLSGFDKRVLIKKMKSGLWNRRSIVVFFRIMGSCMAFWR